MENEKKRVNATIPYYFGCVAKGDVLVARLFREQVKLFYTWLVAFIKKEYKGEGVIDFKKLSYHSPNSSRVCMKIGIGGRNMTDCAILNIVRGSISVSLLMTERIEDIKTKKEFVEAFRKLKKISHQKRNSNSAKK